MRLDGVPQAIAWCAFLSACLAPFLFGAVERSIWIPLCQLWLGMGFVVSRLLSRSSADAGSLSRAVSSALLPIHALFLVQLVPLPASALRILSPGSFAAHFLPDAGDGRFRPLSVSPSATLESWLYFAGLQGLFLALQALPPSRRPAAVRGLLAVVLLLASEGLWQSRTPHPYWLYSRIPVMAPSGLDNASFGPYYNRNHFATAMALGAGWAAGLAMALVRQHGGLIRLVALPSAMARAVLLGGATLLVLMGSAASGSRSGTAAAIAAVGVTMVSGTGTRRLLAPFGFALAGLALAGPAAIERLMNLDVVSSRWAPWADMLRLVPFFPLFGAGIGAFRVAYWPYQMNASYEFWQHAHNEYLQLLIEGGLVGLVVVALSARALKGFVRVTDAYREAFLGAATAFALQAALDFPSRIPANAGLFVCMLGMAIAQREASPRTQKGKGPTTSVGPSLRPVRPNASGR